MDKTIKRTLQLIQDDIQKSLACFNLYNSKKYAYYTKEDKQKIIKQLDIIMDLILDLILDLESHYPYKNRYGVNQ